MVQALTERSLRLRLLTGEEAGYLGAANRAGPLRHLAAVWGLFDLAVLDFALLATLNAVRFEIHYSISLHGVPTRFVARMIKNPAVDCALAYKWSTWV